MSASKKNAGSAILGSDDEALHPIQVVARRTAVSAHLIRAWERRYDAVVPKRSATNRRLYTNEDIQRLRLLNQAIGLGRRIGDVAHLSLTELTDLVSEDKQAIDQAPASGKDEQKNTPQAISDISKDNAIIVENCLLAIEQLNTITLESELAKAAITCSTPMLLEQVIRRLMIIVGQRWQEGSLRLCHEHMATTTIRSFLGAMALETLDQHADGYAPVLLTTTPDGQRHELGALMVALIAASKGWQPLYLGSNTPSDEIVFAAAEKSAKAVALSICYPADDPHLPGTLKKLRRQLPAETLILAGGASANSYKDVLQDINAICPSDLSALQTTLDDLRESHND